MRRNIADNGQQIAKNAITILINLSTDRDVLECLAADDQFLESLLARVTVCQSSKLQYNKPQECIC